MENLHETKLSVYEFVQGNFEPYYEMVASEENSDKIKSKKLENLVLNVLTSKNSVEKDTVKKHIVIPGIIEKNIVKDDIKDEINGLWEEYLEGSIYFS
ncbi:MAG: hypothetical protein ABEJ02_02610, partial [Candidatus Paceibacteria bacterium]